MQETDANELSATEEYDTSTKITFKDGLGCMNKRKQEVILCVRRYKLQTEPQKYYHLKLILFYPWKNEDDLITGFNSFMESYIDKQDVIHKNANLSMRIVKHLTLVLKLLKMMSYHSQHGIPYYLVLQKKMQ